MNWNLLGFIGTAPGFLEHWVLNSVVNLGHSKHRTMTWKIESWIVTSCGLLIATMETLSGPQWLAQGQPQESTETKGVISISFGNPFTPTREYSSWFLVELSQIETSDLPLVGVSAYPRVPSRLLSLTMLADRLMYIPN